MRIRLVRADSGTRAARLFEFDERHPFSPRTQLLQFGELVGKPSSKKAYVYGMSSASKPKSEGREACCTSPSTVSRLWHSVATGCSITERGGLRFWCDTCRFGVTMARWPRLQKRWNSNIVMVMGLWVPSHQSGLRHTKPCERGRRCRHDVWLVLPSSRCVLRPFGLRAGIFCYGLR